MLDKYVGEGDVLLAYLPLAHVLEFLVENVCLFWGVALGYGTIRTLTDASQTGSLDAATSLEFGGNAKEGHYFEGIMDEVRVWDVVRGVAELDADKNRRLAGNEPGLVAYWRFDEGIGLVTIDSGSQKNDGVLQGPPEWLLSDTPICP
jgi:hypothetical protein